MDVFLLLPLKLFVSFKVYYCIGGCYYIFILAALLLLLLVLLLNYINLLLLVKHNDCKIVDKNNNFMNDKVMFLYYSK